MNCQHALRLLPLWVGRDLADSSEAEALRNHLSGCQSCGTQLRQLQSSLDALQSISTITLVADADEARSSLWPRLAMVLKDVPRRRDQFNGWIPAVAMTLAATLMISVSVVQVRREMNTPSNSTVRNLFESDEQFASQPGRERTLQRPALVQPVNFSESNF
jgi:hypothetical protein